MAHAGRVADMKALNSQRWEEHVRERDRVEGGGGGGACTHAGGRHEAPAPTAGALFNRPNPRDAEGNYTNPYVRGDDKFVAKRGELMWADPRGNYKTVSEDDLKLLVNGGWKTEDPNNQEHLVPVYGADVTSVNPASHRKYRIPPTSVVNKVGDCKLFLCCGWRLTAAQFIWWLNFICFLAHTTMVFLTLYFAYWRWTLPDGRRRSMWTDTEHVTVRIHRITQVPTPQMIANNESRWSSGWNLTNPRDGGGNEFYLRDNDMPINFATLTLSFFAISAVFHFWACIVGLFERFWFIYWR